MVREKSRECRNHKPQPFPDPKRKRKPTNLNKHKPNKRTKSTKISSLFPKRGNRNTKRTEKHKNKMTQGKKNNKSPRRINHKATKSKTNTYLRLNKKVQEKSREYHNHKNGKRKVQGVPIRDIKRKETQTRNNWTLMETTSRKPNGQLLSHKAAKWLSKTKRCKRHTHSKTNYNKNKP